MERRAAEQLVKHDRLARSIGQLDAYDGAPWDGREARRQWRHVARDVVGQVGNAARLRARRGFEFVHGDDRTGPDRGDDALHLKILEYRFEQSRVAFQPRLVDLSR